MTKTQKITVAVVMGGKSAEHEVSLQSAKNIIAALDKNKYDVIPIGIDRAGLWHTITDHHLFLNDQDPKRIALSKKREEIIVKQHKDVTKIFDVATAKKSQHIDVVFPIIHGTHGEDGTLQGLCEMMNVAYVGPDVRGSAIGFDKDITKRLLRDADIPVAPFITVHHNDTPPSFATVKKQLGTPLFIKPANAGSSVGVSKVNTAKEYKKALTDAFVYDTKVLIEKAITGRELECAVLGNEDPRASVVGEVTPTGHDFYSYESKYIDEDGALLEIPAKLTKAQQKKIQDTAIRAFRTLACEGMARVDVFLTRSNKVYINEINTLPGFTKISMYPKLWEASGLSYSDLLDELIRLARARHKRKTALHLNFK
jgi:D-alanine-D-alanine ligase